MPPKKNKKQDSGGDEQHLTRIAIVTAERCKPKKCHQECKKSCPVVKLGKLCIEVGPKSKIAYLSEPLCIGCGICVKKCPFEAINIINLPKDLERNTTHRYGPNSFKLHRLPMPRPGQVLGLVGTNGIGKSNRTQNPCWKDETQLGTDLIVPPIGRKSSYTFVDQIFKITLPRSSRTISKLPLNHNMLIIFPVPFEVSWGIF